MSSFQGLSYSAVMLLMLCFVYDTFGVYAIRNRKWRDVITGILVGSIGVAVMLVPWTLRPGVFFDTRWILLSLCGLFFGFRPTAIAVGITGVFRLYQGGPGGIVGTIVIVVTACVGLVWRAWARRKSKPLGLTQLYVFGVVVQLTMLSCMFLMPASMRMQIIKAVAPTILLVYPVITVLVGLVLLRQEARRNAEQELTENRRALARERGLLRGVIDSIPDPIFFKDTEGKYLGCNKPFEAYVGLEEQHLRGKTDFEVIDEEPAAAQRQVEEQLIATRAPVGGQKQVTRPDGTNAVFDTLDTLFTDTDGTLHGVVGIRRDVTERRRAQKLVQESRDFLQKVIDGFPEQVMVVNRDFSIALANRAAAVLVGKEPAELIGLPCHGVSRNSEEPCQGQDHTCPMHAVVASTAPVIVEHIHYDAEGGEHNIEMVAAPIFGSDGDVMQIIESCRDITERRSAEAANRDMERQVLHAQKLESLGVLAGGIAHDFNNILMGVMGNAELAMMRLAPESPARDYIQRIETAAVRATDLATQMLAYSGKGRFVVEAFDINSMVNEMLHLLKTTVAKNVGLNIRLAGRVAKVKGDITQVRQVFMNVITNASEAIGEDNGEITVRTGGMDLAPGRLSRVIGVNEVKEGPYTYIEVRDTGCGMDQETQARIFEPFFTTKFTGRGLGMAATLGIIRGHNGVLELESEPGNGTVVRVYFPAEADLTDTSRVRAPDEQNAGPRSGSETVLVVDDEEAVRETARELLVAYGYTVMQAQDGEHALEVFKEHADTIDVVLLDLTMPRMGGRQTLAELRRLRDNLPVVLSSGFDESEVSPQVTNDDRVEFVQKPYRLGTLLNAFRKVLD